MRSFLCILLLQSAFASANPCATFLTEENIERISGQSKVVTSILSTKDKPILLTDVFQGPQLIIGINVANEGMPYLIAGNTIFHTTDSSTESNIIYIWDANLNVNMPHTIQTTTYHLGAEKADKIPDGYFMRIAGLSAAEIKRIQSQLLEQMKAGSSNTSWNGMIVNLIQHLEAAGVDPNCSVKQLNYSAQIIRNAWLRGFSGPDGKALEAEFYTVNYPSLEKALREQTRAMTINRTFNAAMIGGTCLAAGGVFYLFYQMFARSLGLPQIP